MNCPGVSVQHVKSHLQKHRLTLRGQTGSPTTFTPSSVYTARTVSYDQYTQERPSLTYNAPAIGFSTEKSMAWPAAATSTLPVTTMPVVNSQASLQTTLTRSPIHAFQETQTTNTGVYKPTADSNLQKIEVLQRLQRLLDHVYASAPSCCNQEAQSRMPCNTASEESTENKDPSYGDHMDAFHLHTLAETCETFSAALEEQQSVAQQKPLALSHIVTKAAQPTKGASYEEVQRTSSPSPRLEPEQPRTPINLSFPVLASVGSTTVLGGNNETGDVLEQLLALVRNMGPQLKSSARMQQRSYTSLQMQLQKNRAQEQALKEFLAVMDSCKQNTAAAY